MSQQHRPRLEDRRVTPGWMPPPRPENTDLSPTQPADTEEADRDAVLEVQGVYIISVAARLLDVHPQTLRKYERLGLIRPGRTIGMLRLYSRDDIRKVRLIQHLSGNLGLNLAGVEFALGMVDNLLTLRQRLAGTTEGTPAEQAVDQEFAALFRSMDLPLDD